MCMKCVDLIQFNSIQHWIHNKTLNVQECKKEDRDKTTTTAAAKHVPYVDLDLLWTTSNSSSRITRQFQGLSEEILII